MSELIRIGLVVDDGGAAEKVERLIRDLEKLAGVADTGVTPKMDKASKSTRGATAAVTQMDRVSKIAEGTMRKLAFRLAELPGPLGSLAQAFLRVGLTGPKVIGVFGAIAAGALVVRGARKEFQELAKTSDDLHKKLEQLGSARAPQLTPLLAVGAARADVEKAEKNVRRLGGGAFAGGRFNPINLVPIPDVREAAREEARANLATAENVENLAQIAENWSRATQYATKFARAVELGEMTLDAAYEATVATANQWGVLPETLLDIVGLSDKVTKRWEQASQIRFAQLEKARNALRDMQPMMAGLGAGSIGGRGSNLPHPGSFADRVAKAFIATDTLGDRADKGGLASVLDTIPLKDRTVPSFDGTIAGRAMREAERTKEIWADTFASMESVSAGFFLNFRQEGLNAFVTLADQMFDVWLEMLGRMTSMKLFQALFGTASGRPSAVEIAGKPYMVDIEQRHQGGVVGESWAPRRMVDPRMFLTAPRYHRGGVVGDEVPIIARRGEVVLPKGQGVGGTTAVHVDQHMNFLAMDPRGLRDMLLQNRGVIAGAVLSVAQESRAFRRALLRGE